MSSECVAPSDSPKVVGGVRAGILGEGWDDVEQLLTQ